MSEQNLNESKTLPSFNVNVPMPEVPQPKEFPMSDGLHNVTSQNTQAATEAAEQMRKALIGDAKPHDEIRILAEIEIGVAGEHVTKLKGFAVYQLDEHGKASFKHFEYDANSETLEEVKQKAMAGKYAAPLQNSFRTI